MNPIPRRLGRLRTGLEACYPDLAVLRRAMKSADWAGVTGYFAALPARGDHGVAVSFAGDIAGAEKFLQRTVDTERDSSLARTLLASRFISLAWKARTGYYARHVRPAQWTIFFDYLRRAERLLSDATAIDPTSAAAWTARLITARGLNLGVDEGRRRYEKAAEHCDEPFSAQRQLTQTLCPKWSGTTPMLHAFARECFDGARPGSLSPTIVAYAHVEHMVSLDHQDAGERYIGQRQVRDEIRAAALSSVLHPDHVPGHGGLSAHSVFAFAFYHGGYYDSAAPHFAALGNRLPEYPWEMWSEANAVKASFRAARHSVRSR